MDDFDEHMHSMQEGAWSDPGHARARVAVALRSLVHRSVANVRPDADPHWAGLAAALEGLLTGPDPAPDASRYEPADRPVIRPNSRGTHPLVGPANPVAPPLVLGLTDATVTADVVYDARHEGLPGFVQGGFIAAGFDLILGQAVARSGKGGVTAGLSVRYVITTPIGVPLRYDAWTERADGRKTWVKARLVRVSDGTVTAEAEGLFIAPRAPLHAAE